MLVAILLDKLPWVVSFRAQFLCAHHPSMLNSSLSLNFYPSWNLMSTRAPTLNANCGYSTTDRSHSSAMLHTSYLLSTCILTQNLSAPPVSLTHSLTHSPSKRVFEIFLQTIIIIWNEYNNLLCQLTVNIFTYTKLMNI